MNKPRRISIGLLSLLLILALGCRSDVDIVVEKQFRAGIETEILYSELRFGTAIEASENPNDTIYYDSLNLYCIPEFTDSLLTGGLFYGLDSISKSPEHLKKILFTRGGEIITIPSRIFKEEFIQIDGNRLVRVFYNKKENRWQAKVENIWTNPHNFQRFKL